jgi:hypothetical protein
MQSGSVDAIPPHLFIQASSTLVLEEDEDEDEEALPPQFNAMLVNVSLRNTLSRGPVTSGSHV